MILTCQSCNTRFKLDARFLKPSGSKVRCSKCRNVFVAYPPSDETEPSMGSLPEAEREQEAQSAETQVDMASAAASDAVDSENVDDKADSLEGIEAEAVKTAGTEELKAADEDVSFDEPQWSFDEIDAEKSEDKKAQSEETESADDFTLSFEGFDTESKADGDGQGLETPAEPDSVNDDDLLGDIQFEMDEGPDLEEPPEDLTPIVEQTSEPTDDVSLPPESFEISFEEEPENQETDASAEEVIGDIDFTDEIVFEDFTETPDRSEVEKGSEPEDAEEELDFNFDLESLESDQAVDEKATEDTAAGADLFDSDKKDGAAEADGTAGFEDLAFDLDIDFEQPTEETAKETPSDEEEDVFDFEVPNDVNLFASEEAAPKPTETLAENYLEDGDEIGDLELDFDLESDDENASTEFPVDFDFELDTDSTDGEMKKEKAAQDASENQDLFEMESELFAPEKQAAEPVPVTSGTEAISSAAAVQKTSESSEAFTDTFTDKGFVDVDEEEEDDQSIAAAHGFEQKKKKRASLPLVLLLILVILGGGGYGAYTYLGKDMNIEIPYVSDFFKPKVEDKSGNLRIDFYDLDSKFLENETAGKMFVITGKVKNEYDDPRSFIRVTGKLYQKEKKLAKTATVYAGNMISDLELSKMAPAKIQNQLDNRFGAKSSNVKVGTGTVLPFMIVFNELPEDLEEFSIEVAGSAPATQ